ncbi:MAG TPA: DUF3226 domain-containing protein [Caulobacteraceae bacterium]|nr:DUF3226 domain-containing protein [Caulobacteraceae bacterium]
MTDAPAALEHEALVLCEGAADQNFLRKLLANRGGFPPVDFLPHDAFHGRDGFGRMIATVRPLEAFRRIRGVLIVADSHDDPEKTFKHVYRQLCAVPDIPLPEGLIDVAFNTDHTLGIGIITLPDEKTPGSLESLLARELADPNPWIDGCVDAFLSCGEGDALTWPPEKLAKARYHSMVAALHRKDPSRAASATFDKNPVIPIAGHAFDGVEQRLRAFFAAIGLAP